MLLFRASEGILAQKVMTLASTILLLQQMEILPNQGMCKSCSVVITDNYKRNKMNFIFWQCPSCKGASGKTALRANTVLANSNIKLEQFVMLLWAFADRGRTKKLGGVGQICEIDEFMCGKCKFGKGDRSKRRGTWIFGGIMRNNGNQEGFAFAEICPHNKRTKKVLWPIIQENLIVLDNNIL